MERDLVVFDDLARMENRQLQKLVVEFSSEEWAVALQQAPNPVTQAVLGNMSSRARKILKEDMRYYADVDSAKRIAAREKVVQRIRAQKFLR